MRDRLGAGCDRWMLPLLLLGVAFVLPTSALFWIRVDDDDGPCWTRVMTRLNREDRCGLPCADPPPPATCRCTGEFRPVNRGNENERSLVDPLLAAPLLPNMVVCGWRRRVLRRRYLFDQLTNSDSFFFSSEVARVTMPRKRQRWATRRGTVPYLAWNLWTLSLLCCPKKVPVLELPGVR